MAKSKEIVICEPMYFPPVSFFKMLKNYKGLQLEIKEYYRKGTYRNRCYLPSANGIQMLSIPLEKGKNQQMPIDEVKICYRQNWQREHLKAIKVIYRKSPFFEYYEFELDKLFQSKNELLIDWNLQLFEFILKAINLKIEVTQSENYLPSIPEFDDWRNGFDIKKTNNDFIRYHQVFEEKIGFMPNMSILDLLFAEGNNVHSFV